MGLLSIFKRKSGDRGSTPPADTNPDSVQEARTRARRRLTGASVLVVVGVIGFPLLFETQPRPIPVDIPIEIPRKDSVPPLVMPAAKPTKPVATAPVEALHASAPDIVYETQAEAGREVSPPAIKTPSPTAHTATTLPQPAETVELAPKPVVTTAKPASKPASGSDDAQRAQSLHEVKPADKDSAKKDSRFVVQVGAFTENAPAHEMRLKVEKLGLKSYAQVAQTSQGHRIRIRVGPFATREEAEKAQAKIKASGAQAVVLTL